MSRRKRPGSTFGRPTGHRSRSGSTALDRRWCWSTVPFATTPRSARWSRNCAMARPRTRWIVEALVPAVTQPAMPSSVSSRTWRRSWMPSPLAPAGRLRCGATPSEPTARWAAPPSPSSVAHLVLYEPSLGITYPAGSIEAVEAAIAAGDVESAVVAILVGILEMTEAEVDDLRLTPQWPTLLAAGPTVPRECRVEDGWSYQPSQFDAITAVTLLLAGSDSPHEPGRGNPPRRRRDSRRRGSACSTVTATSRTRPTRRWSPRSFSS